ncbi:MAG: hypothetical protein COB67_00080 [SAR324 cluster bacterium]|uniref:Uncharacterized protein n=1 Tax=SAR324 cluster bacterium TaxID=2024889 RepID=A0A2A4TB86_9DELT|nr:MAG: hypothetical protein COB67_00080 [SAR324 cluster bacterium]
MADITEYKYIFDHEALNEIPITDILERFCEPKGSNKYTCPGEHKGSKVVKVHTGTNSCHCYDNQCEFYSNGSLMNVAIAYKKSFSEACRWLSEEFNKPMIPNPEYKGSDKATSNYTPRTTGFTAPAPIFEIEYEEFDPLKAYSNVKVETYLDRYDDMDVAQRLKMVYTFMYRFILKSFSQKAKFGFYLDKRGLTYSKAMNSIAYMSVKDAEVLLQEMRKHFNDLDLMAFGILYDKDHKHAGQWKFSSIDKGGLLFVPSFDLYSDMVTGFMVRPTHPPKWMIDKKTKELQLSKTDIVKPFPFGLTNQLLTSDNPYVFMTEGHPDGFVFPDVIDINGKEFDTLRVPNPGTSGLIESKMKVLKNKTVLIAYDQDEAGRSACFGYVMLQSNKEGKLKFPDDEKGHKELELVKHRHELNAEKYSLNEYKGILQKLGKAGVNAIPISWDIVYGGDLNDLEINGNFEEVWETAFKPLLR